MLGLSALNDFATEDFINKNIRVRPVSGITNKDELRRTRTATAESGRSCAYIRRVGVFNVRTEPGVGRRCDKWAT